MSIQVKESSMVYPAMETPNNSLWLSKIDMMVGKPYTHIEVLYIYPHPNYNTINNVSHISPSRFFDTKILKEALSKALVPFYPVAGRLVFNDDNGRYEIDCNAKGVLFVEVETTHALDDLGDYINYDSQLRKLVFPNCDYSQELSSIPLLLVQLTRFKCGSVCLGLAQHHHVADGVSYSHFISSWARLVKGLDLEVQPVHDRASYLGPRDPPQVKFRHLEYEPSLPLKDLFGEMVAVKGMFELTRDQMNTLKMQAISQGHTLSTFAVQAGHVWRSVCKARGLAADQDVKLYIPVNGRSRLKDREPLQGYFGNLLFLAICVEKAGDIMSKPLWFAASKIQVAVKRKEDIEHLRSAIDFVESHPDLTAIGPRQHTFTCPNLFLNSWSRLPLHETDFGWGRPSFLGLKDINFEGQGYIKPKLNENGSFLLDIKLFAPHMELFKKYLYDF